jgi:tellurite resistance protein
MLDAPRRPWSHEDEEPNRRKTVLLRALALALLVLASPRLAAARGPSTPEERKRALQTVRKLEKEPLSRKSMEDRKWLFQWIVEIPDIQVTSCKGPLDPLQEDDEGYGKLLYLQSVFGMTAFLIEHSDRKGDWAAIQTAGIESVLRAYDSIRKADSEARSKELDRLAAAQKSGKLLGIVKKEMAECGKPEEERMGPAPRDAI